MDREKYLTALKDDLLHSANWQKIVLSRNWTANVPAEAGVYAFRENGKIVYVGETGNLKGRMNDLLDSRHHTIRRTIGKKYFSQQKGFAPATTKTKFPEPIELLVNDHICKNLSIAFLKVPLGRKELEEFIECEIEMEIKLNKRGKRK